jgi:hypothetical protein
MRRVVLIFAVLASSSTLAQAQICDAWGRCFETEDPDEEIYTHQYHYPHYYQPRYYQPYYHQRHHYHDDEGEW